MEDADQAIGKRAQGFVVGLVTGSELVVIAAGSW